MRIREIIREAAPAVDPLSGLPPTTGADPAPGAMPPMPASPMPATPPPLPAGLDDPENDLSAPDHSVSKSKDYGSILNVLEPLRQNLLFHHSDPQFPVDKILRALNNLPDTQGAFTYETLKSAVDSGELDGIVDKLSTDSVSGKNIIIFKKDEVDAPDSGPTASAGGGTGGGKNPASTVASMAKRAASK
jgi:hypothetical protein